MAIPEHAKCVECHKRTRANRQSKKWEKVRRWREKRGEAVKGQRIRTIISVEIYMQCARHIKRFGTYKEYINQIYNTDLRHYRRYGKYDD